MQKTITLREYAEAKALRQEEEKKEAERVKRTKAGFEFYCDFVCVLPLALLVAAIAVLVFKAIA